MARVNAVILSKGPLTGKSQRGHIGAQLHELTYDAADDDVLPVVIDTIDLGAGSVAFHIDNRFSPQPATLELYVHNGNAPHEQDTLDVALMDEIAFKDLTGSETGAGAGGLAIDGGISGVFTLTEATNITSGTFTLTYDGQTTDAIAHDATAATVQIALEKLSTIGTGNVTVTGGILTSAPMVVTFTGDLAYRALAAGGISRTQTSLTGTFNVVETTAGADGDAVNVIVSYASYPEPMSMRFFVLVYTPDAAMGQAAVIPVHVAIK